MHTTLLFNRRQTTREQDTQTGFLLLWPWPWFDDHDIRIWPRHSDLHTKIWTFYSITDRQTRLKILPRRFRTMTQTNRVVQSLYLQYLKIQSLHLTISTKQRSQHWTMLCSLCPLIELPAGCLPLTVCPSHRELVRCTLYVYFCVSVSATSGCLAEPRPCTRYTVQPRMRRKPTAQITFAFVEVWVRQSDFRETLSGRRDWSLHAACLLSRELEVTRSDNSSYYSYKPLRCLAAVAGTHSVHK